MTHQIDPLIKALIVLSSSATWWPVYMPKEGKNHIRNSRWYLSISNYLDNANGTFKKKKLYLNNHPVVGFLKW